MAANIPVNRRFDDETTATAGVQAGRSGWSAVWALTLCVSTLIASEFMPVSLLTPIASDLHVSEGAAGQAIAISGLFALLTSLALSTLIRGLDRRRVLLGLTILMLVSGLIVAAAPNYLVLMIGRALIGVVIGGFWSMTTATVMRLVSEDQVPRALATLNGGNALATTIAAPLGSFLGQYIGWRGAFLIVVPLAAATFVWQWLTLPAMPSDRDEARSSTIGLLRDPAMRSGMLAVSLMFAGQFMLFTYLRPFLERTTGMSVSLLSLALLVMGAAGLLGTTLIGRVIARGLTVPLVLAPIGMAAIALMLVALGGHALPTMVLLGLWGLIGTALPVAWWTWLSRTLPNDAEAGGGLMVAVVQLAIMSGAAGGGLLFDAGGHGLTFITSAVILVASGLIGTRSVRRSAATI